ncbi:MAG: serine/threonine-protein phosphatase [Planctomycetes bacterium]|nr:serine/threonine-protein phosphatase [Planctomycetota bacterium]
MAADTDQSPDTHRMQCMEVWGGNEAIDNGAVMPGLDAWIYSRPYKDDPSGGDVHFVSNCASGRITRMLIADVSGHGTAVSAIAANLRTLMRRYINYLDQTRFIEAVNREFAHIGREGGFATSIAATFWAPTAVLVTCNAGHPRPLWYRARKKQWQHLFHDRHDGDDDGAVNLPLGVIEPTRYPQFGVRLRRDDLVLIYTDSLIESRDAQGKQIGEDGLLQIAQGLDPKQPNKLIRDLLQAVEDHRGGAPAEDDVTILTLRHNGTLPRMTMSDRIASMGRMLKMIVERLRPGTPPIAWPEVRVETIGGTFFNRLNWRWGGKQPNDD